jgi:pimeloyl-ACP methyl ester carboxylesterase
MKIIFTLISLYFLAMLYLFLTQDKKVFQTQYATYYSPTHVKKIYFKTSDGLILEGGKVGNAKELVLYFGGNANNVLEFLDKTAYKIKDFSFIAFNYPGFGNSEGKPSEQNILKYAIELFDKYKPSHLIGRSLGSAVASYVSSKRKVKTLLLITPFDSIEEIAKSRYPIFPISILLKHKFKEIEFLKHSKATKINAIFVENDNIIPIKSTNHLLKEIKFNKTITIKASHGRIYEYPHIEKIIEKLLKE